MPRRLLPIAIALSLSGLARADRPTPSPLASARPSSLEAAPADSPHLPLPDEAEDLMRELDRWLTRQEPPRTHLQLDRPLYRPGDTVNFRAWTLAARDMAPQHTYSVVQLVDPRGIVLQTATLDQKTAGSFALAPEAAGGSWILRLSGAGIPAERPFVVQSFEAPRIKKEVEFLREGYGPGELVVAQVTLERATGEPFARKAARVQVQVEGRALDPISIQTDSDGVASIQFALPADLARPDVLMTVLVDDGGVTESISRPVPVHLDQMSLTLFPEGGDLVAGLPGRVYFEATDAHGEPLDVKGTVSDEQGKPVATLESWVSGRGHVSFTPLPGRDYTAQIDGPRGTRAVFPMPAARTQGCTLRHHDDLRGEQQAVRVSVACTQEKEVLVVATQQGELLDKAAVQVSAGETRTVWLHSRSPAMASAPGVARVTALDLQALEPLAERLIYRNKNQQLSIALEPDRQRYSPGDQVRLTVRTADAQGRPVPAELALSVVDDALLSFADDDEHDLVAQVLLQADLPEPIEDVAELFEPDEEDGPLGLDLVLGTRGWRRFDWQTLLMYTQPWRYEEILVSGKQKAVDVQSTSVGQVLAKEFLQRIPAGRTYQSAIQTVPGVTNAMGGNPNMGGGATNENTYMLDGANRRDPVRQFAPPVREDAPVVRSDFRDTLLWQPVVQTSKEGLASVTFQLSDAITGFRAVAEGVGDGRPGRGEALIASSLPFHLDTELPQALSLGDELLLPVTLALDSGEERAVVDLGLELSGLQRGKLPSRVPLDPGERRTVHVPLTASSLGQAQLSLTARAGKLSDAVIRPLPVASRGFPAQRSLSGVLEGQASHTLDLTDVLPGTLTAQVTVMPSTISEIFSGLEGMIRMPGGCFEQTSSTNYPNVVLLDLMERADRAGKLKVDPEKVLKQGYQLLAGYQVQSGGFETFGQGPGKEALSAFGLLQFHDMKRVFPVSAQLIEENTAYLYHQRDGKGGYRVTGSSSHGYGTAPPEVLDAYITYALVETGHTDLPHELAATAALARRTDDPYRLALAALTLLAVDPPQGKAAAARLAALQARDGSFPGSETSITRSENHNLLVEATALSTLAMVRAGQHDAAQRAATWLREGRTGGGVWGATQGNALALKALAAATERSALEEDATLEVRVDGKRAGELRVLADQLEPVKLDFSEALTPGKHEVTLLLDGGELPYTLTLDWATELPPSDPDRRVELATSLAQSRLSMGQTTRLTASLSNRTQEVVPEPIARIGLPAGLEPQTWQLEQLVERGEVAFFETRPREVTLYWHGLGVDEVHEVALDLVAEVPGTFTAPASSAWPYYDDEAKAWVAGTQVIIAP